MVTATLEKRFTELTTVSNAEHNQSVRYSMYMLRRVYKAKYRQGKLVASLVQKQQKIYESAGRSKGTVYFNAGTVPGEPDTVVLEWTQDNLGSPYMSGGSIPREALQVGGQVREHIESQEIEFWELMTPEKMDDV